MKGDTLLKIIIALIVPIVALLVVLNILDGLNEEYNRGQGYDYSFVTFIWLVYIIGIGIFEYHWLKRKN